MPPMVTPFYAGFLALLYIALSARVIKHRRSARISLGDGNDVALQQKIRVQSNCAEYAPIGIVLLLLAELQGAPEGACTFWAACFCSGGCRMRWAWAPCRSG